MKKTLTLLLVGSALYISSSVIISCDDNCDVGPLKTRLKTVSTELKKIIGIHSTENGLNTYEVTGYYSDEKGIRYDSLGIDIKNEIENYTQVIKKSSFMGKAYACDPVVSFSKISMLRIFSDKAYDANHPIGSNLTDVVYIRNGYITVPTSYDEVYGGNIFINFKSAPSIEDTHNISISITLEDGRTFNSVLPEVRIRK